jgi:plastocyanin
MRQTAHGLTVLLIAGVVLAACNDDDFTNIVPANATVSMQDQCDSASFNAALGAGTCNKAGSITFATFNAELGATQRVATWRFVPADLTVRVGQAINAVNNGGEDHTFTEVETFGGGIVPALNTASGNLTMAPECALLTSADHVAPGATFTTDVPSTVGTEHYQCCIHPWMRATVTVNP